MSDPPIDQQIKALAQEAVDWAQGKWRITLDFSEESVKSVEAILTDLHDLAVEQFNDGTADQAATKEALWGMALAFGGYVGEVIRRRWGGRWATETSVHPGTVVTLRIGTTEIWPPAKAMKRLLNGPEDNVWDYFRVIRDGLNAALPP